MSKIAWIGLGVMGFPMAGHIRDKGGDDLVVYNRTAARADEWVAKHGGSTAATPAEAADGADFVFCCVGNDSDLRAVTTGTDGAFETLKSGAIFIDNTTASADIARELYAAAQTKGASFLDAPVSGGQAGAENGALTVMVGGDAEVFARAEPVIMHYAKQARILGPAGSGQLVKMVNQICIAGLVQGLSEGVHFAQKAGLDIPALMDVISRGAAQSWQMENRWETMMNGEFEHGFAVDWMRKDLSMCLKEAGNNGASLPVTALVDQLYGEVQKMGGSRWDTSSLLARLNNADRKPG